MICTSSSQLLGWSPLGTRHPPSLTGPQTTLLIQNPCAFSKQPRLSSVRCSKRLGFGTSPSGTPLGTPVGTPLQRSRKKGALRRIRAKAVASEEPLGAEVLFKTTAEIDKAVLMNAVTASGAAIADPVMSLVDTMFVGYLGTIPMAALGPNSAIFSAIYFLFTFTGAIVTTELVGLAHGADDQQRLQRNIITSVIVASVIGCITTAGLVLWGPSLLRGMGTNTEMMKDTYTYLSIRALAVPAALLLLVFQAVYRAVLDLRTPCIVVLIIGACNIVLDPIMMFNFGWGVAGASIATTLSQWIGVGLFAVLLLRDKSPFWGEKGKGADGGRGQIALPEWRECWHYISECGGLLFRAVNIIAIYTLASIVATRTGTLVAAGHQLVNQIQTFQLTILWAFMEVGQTMVVNTISRSGKSSARVVGNRIIYWCVLTSILLAFGTWAGREQLARLFLRDDNVLRIVDTAMLPACLMILTGWNNAMEGVLLGAGDMQFVVAAFFPAAGTGIAMLLYALWKGACSLPYIWWALTTYYVLLTVQYCVRYWVPKAKGSI